MKNHKNTLHSLAGVFLVFTLFIFVIGWQCPSDPETSVPIIGATDLELNLQSSADFVESGGAVDLAELIDQVIADNPDYHAGQVTDVALTSVSFLITNNQSAEGTTLSGTMDIGQSAEELETLLNMSELELDAVEGVKQTADLSEAGVSMLNTILNDLFDESGRLDFSGEHPLVFHYLAEATPSPPPDVKFTLTVTLRFTFIVVT